MDKFSRFYGWFVLIATGLPATIRLITPRAMAEMTSEKISDEKKRKRHRMWGWISLVSSLGFIPIYFFLWRQAWVIIAIVIGMLTGLEMVRNADSPSPDSLTRQNVIFGIVYAAICVVTYFTLIRK